MERHLQKRERSLLAEALIAAAEPPRRIVSRERKPPTPGRPPSQPLETLVIIAAPSRAGEYGWLHVVCRTIVYLAIYIVVVGIAAFIAIAGASTALLAPFTLVLLAVVPPILLVCFLLARFRHVIDVRQFISTTLWAMALIGPLILFFLLVTPAIVATTPPLDPILSAFLKAFIQAGLIEESLKFNAIRGVLYNDVVADPRALLVYASGAGAGFALIENLLYVLRSGLVTGIARAFLSIPAHTSWAMITGAGLAERKFLGRSHNYVVIVLPSVLLHGVYNFALFLLEAIPDLSDGGFIALYAVSPIVVVVSAALVYARQRAFRHVPLVEVPALQRAGLIPYAYFSSFGCCDNCIECLPVCGPTCARAIGAHERNQRGIALNVVEQLYRERLEAAQARGSSALSTELALAASSTIAPVLAWPADVEGTGSESGEAAAPALAADATSRSRPLPLMLVTVPDLHIAGHELKVEAPWNGRRFKFVPPPQGCRPGSILVVLCR